MSVVSTILSILIIIPVVPLIAYVIGLLVPASHIVSRSCSFKISSKRLWNILTDVSKYPEWQSKVDDVMIEEISKEDNNNKIVFIELSTRKRHYVIIHHERKPYQCLIRILKERPNINISGNDSKKIPTFSGSWTFEITQEKESKDQVNLKITEQGVIKKPIARVTHLLLYGFHSRIDRFMNDLHKLVNKQAKEKEAVGQEATVCAPLDEGENQQTSTILQPFDSAVLPSKNNRNGIVADVEETINKQQKSSVADDQQIETSDSLTTESNSVNGDKEWDLMNEIYERPQN